MQKEILPHGREVHSHLIYNDLLVCYTVWFFHGEFCLQTQANMNQVVDTPIRNNETNINLDGQGEFRVLFHTSMRPDSANTVQDNWSVGSDDDSSKLEP